MTTNPVLPSSGYGYRFGRRTTDTRPLVAIDVDGVIALDSPARVPAGVHSVSAFGKWRREILVPDVAASVVAELARDFEVAWTGAWSYAAHEALRDVLDLPREPWTFMPVQFNAVPVVRDYADGRPWAWITELSLAGGAADEHGLIAGVDPQAGLAALDLDGLRTAMRGLQP